MQKGDYRLQEMEYSYVLERNTIASKAQNLLLDGFTLDLEVKHFPSLSQSF